MKDMKYHNADKVRTVIWLLLITIVLLEGCQGQARLHPGLSSAAESRSFTLREISVEHAAECLSELGIQAAQEESDGETFAVTGSASQLEITRVVLDLIDTSEEFAVEALLPASKARSLPSNEQIAHTLGTISIGTFSDPPTLETGTRGIIDIYDDWIVALVPARFHADVLALVEEKALPAAEAGAVDVLHDDSTEPVLESATGENEVPALHKSDRPAPLISDTKPIMKSSSESDQSFVVRTDQSTEDGLPSPGLEEKGQTEGMVLRPGSESSRPAEIRESAPTVDSTDNEQDEMPEIISLRPVKIIDANEGSVAYSLSPLSNDEDTLELDLPPTVGLADLLDLAAEYLDLDYMYEPSQVSGQTITLKLNGKLQGKIRVKDLYPLLESVLKFKGFVMTRHEGRLVTVVPMEEVLDVDPRLVGSDTKTLEAGEMVITRVLELKYVDALSAANLLENMRLSMAVLPVEETKSLIITCYARRMTRIEQLLRTIDKPGRTRIFRSRQLKYTMAHMLISKLGSLAEQMRTVPITIAPMQAGSPRTSQAGINTRSPVPTQPPVQTVGISQVRRNSVDVDDRMAVYLDADERTNRILLLGYDEQISLVEKLIDALDLPGHDLQTLKVYFLRYINAEDARAKLEGLEIVGKLKATARTASAQLAQMTTAAANTARGSVAEGDNVEEPRIVVMEATNALLINATEEQHSKIERIMSYIDMAAEDLRFLKVYDVNYLDAEDMRNKLVELGIVAPAGGSSGVRRALNTANASSQGDTPDRSQLAVVEQAGTHQLFEQSQVVVRETTNSLVVYATQEQHTQIREAIPHLDAEALDQAIPYEIYFLENQDPEPLAEVLDRLIKETIIDKEDKVQRTILKTEDEITIVPDKGTFSLIVYANRKNQDWISKLIKALDKRRPQVLIDVTLVEITQTDTFNYDLNMIRSWHNLESTSGISGVNPSSDTKGNLLESASGDLTAFYGDGQIQALLTAVQTKNYGRVLAKPKILVNDNEPGLVKTTDTTYVTIASAIPISSGGTNEATLVQTEQKYESYEAGITLDITPHISEGNLLRLSISLTRSDFLPTEDAEKPPNTTASEVSTAVTVPDGSTIILGGLLKLNQNKGDTKVPLLGDVPIVGGLFRSISNSDKQSKLYVFVKAEIIRPAGQGDQSMENLRTISERNRKAFEEHEAEVQNHQSWPGMKSGPVAPAKVLDAR